MPGFAFGVSKSYLWDASSIASKGKRVSINAVYKQNYILFDKTVEMLQETFRYTASTFPGVEYPFPIITAFNGDGAMEHPAMVNDTDLDDLTIHWYITCHEAGHQYFPFYVGTNERRHAWMDEGVTTFYSREFTDIAMNDTSKKQVKQMITNYTSEAGTKKEIPPMIHSNNMREGYRTASYNRSAVALYVLRETVGKEKFNKAFKDFIENWNRKHPMPEDFFNTFNRVCGEDLAWFWKAWYYELAYPDLAVKSVSENKITVKNIGKMPVPIYLEVTFTDGTSEKIEKNTSVWKTGKQELEFETSKKEIKQVKIGNDFIPDAEKNNNLWTK